MDERVEEVEERGSGHVFVGFSVFPMICGLGPLKRMGWYGEIRDEKTPLLVSCD